MYHQYFTKYGVATVALCPKCRREVPAIIKAGSDANLNGGACLTPAVWMDKHCPRCGDSSVVLEKDANFYARISMMVHVPSPHTNYYYINITNHCNTACPNCYADIDNSSIDPSIDEIMADVRTSPNPFILLCGGEPTTRTDLPDLIRRIKNDGRYVGLMTNGIKLAEPNYAVGLKVAGLDRISISVHGNDRTKAVSNCTDAGLDVIGSFTINDLAELPGVLATAENLKLKEIRIRAAFRVGRCVSKPRIFLSDMGRALQSAGCVLDEFGHHYYHLVGSFGDMRVLAFVLPDIETINLGDTNINPRMRARDGIVRYLSHSFIINERV